jgi:hypothetical protein
MARYLGGLITADESLVIPADNYGDTSAPGVWTLAEAELLNKSNRWPTAGNFLTRAVFAGGVYNATDTIDYVDIATTGNATDFGNLTSPRGYCAGCASATRGVAGMGVTTGFSTSGSDFIDYITIASTGNGTDFGNLTVSRNNGASCNSSTRGVFMNGRVDTGSTGNVTLDYITISSTGNATDFGDSLQLFWANAGTSSSTRGVFGGGYAAMFNIEYITIASTGNGTYFGDLSDARYGLGAFSNGTRAVFGGGTDDGIGKSNVIDYITIASTGSGTDFGDLTQARETTGASSSTRGIFGGGYTGSRVNTMDYVTIASTGNATDFGDLTEARDGIAGISNVNGGLQ